MEAATLTVAEQLRRDTLWKKLLSELPPDERERIENDPLGGEAITLAVTVEACLSTDEWK